MKPSMEEVKLASKEELERLKLQAEVRLLEAKLHSDRDDLQARQKARSWDSFRSWVPTVISALTILCTVLTVGIQSCQYFSSRAREYDVQIDEKMLKLAERLSDPKPEVRTDAALLLSAYELEALPLLLSYLKRTDTPQPVIDALELIQGKGKVAATEVADPLLDTAQEVFASYRPGSELIACRNFILAIGQLGKSREKRALSLLKKLRSELDPDDSAALSEPFRQSCTALTGKECDWETIDEK